MKTVVILDSEATGANGMEAVLERRGFLVLRAGTAGEIMKLVKSGQPGVDLIIAEAAAGNGAPQTEVAVQIQQCSRETPILLICTAPLDKWLDDDFRRFGLLLSGRVDLLVKPLSQASFVAKAHALIYLVSYRESRRLFESAAAVRSDGTPAHPPHAPQSAGI